MTTPNIWQAILQDMPETAYFAQQPRFGKSQKQREYYNSQFNNLWNQYQGMAGRQLAQGLPPTETPDQYFANYDFEGNYNALAPSTRGVANRQYAPFTRFLGF